MIPTISFITIKMVFDITDRRATLTFAFMRSGEAIIKFNQKKLY
jgi:hypothetical protein